MIYLWADTHFNHEAVIGFCNRGDSSVEAMNERLIANWNTTVGEKDTIWFLGDFGFGRMEHIRPIWNRLQGHKHLIVGNHDKKNRPVLQLPWKDKRDLFTLKADGIRAELCHYPFDSWLHAQHGALHAHGHTHGTIPGRVNRFDVGADVEEFPVAITELERRRNEARPGS